MHLRRTLRGGQTVAAVDCGVQVGQDLPAVREELATSSLGMRQERPDQESRAASSASVQRRRLRDEPVCVIGNGECYHQLSCGAVGAALVRDWNSPRMFQKSAAIRAGYRPCKQCNPA